MHSREIVIYAKSSKFESDQITSGADALQVVKTYRQLGMPDHRILTIVASSVRQEEALRKLRSLLDPEVRVVTWHPKWEDDCEAWRADVYALENAALIVSLGGDNQFQFATHYCKEGFLLGLNSDPETSKGKLLWGSVDDFEPHVERLLKEDFKVEHWQRLDLFLNDSFVGRASNQIALSARDLLMSRHIIELPNAASAEQKGSGLIISTGAGSTGWYRSAKHTVTADFPRNAPEARWFVREAQREDDGTVCLYNEGSLYPGQSLRVRSLNAGGGFAGVDDKLLANDKTHENFNLGSVATISLSDKPLKVVTF